MTLTRWDPTREVLSLRDAMNRLLDDTLVRGMLDWATQDSGPRVARLPLDVYTTDNEIVVVAPVPGINPDDVEITLEGETLTIRGEIPARLENVDYVFSECYHGPFSRTLQLNVPIDVDKVEATFENGMLTLVLPKAEAVKPKVIKVQAK